MDEFLIYLLWNIFKEIKGIKSIWNSIFRFFQTFIELL